jgi:hypothetical protein
MASMVLERYITFPAWELRYYSNGHVEGWQDGRMIWAGQWAKGWTHFVPYEAFGSAMLLVYNAQTGHVNFTEITAKGWGSITALKWRPDWERLETFTENQNLCLRGYRQGEISENVFTSKDCYKPLQKRFT